MDLFAMIRAHAAWKGKLFEAISGGDAPDRAAASADDRCALGQWLHGDGRARCGDDPRHAMLVERHRDFHRTVGSLLTLIEEGRRREAVDALFGGAYDQASRQVVAAMIALHEGCRKGDHA